MKVAVFVLALVATVFAQPGRIDFVAPTVALAPEMVNWHEGLGLFIVPSVFSGSISLVNDSGFFIPNFAQNGNGQGLAGSDITPSGDIFLASLSFATVFTVPIPPPGVGDSSLVKFDGNGTQLDSWDLTNVTGPLDNFTSFPNDVAVSGDAAYITDSYNAKIWFVNTTTAEVSVFVQKQEWFGAANPVGPIGPNGIALHPSGQYLILVITFPQNPIASVWKVPIATPQDASIVSFGALSGIIQCLDGARFDSNGVLYLTGCDVSSGAPVFGLFLISSTNDFTNATIDQFYPACANAGLQQTTVALRGNFPYVTYTSLNVNSTSFEVNDPSSFECTGSETPANTATATAPITETPTVGTDTPSPTPTPTPTPTPSETVTTTGAVSTTATTTTGAATTTTGGSTTTTTGAVTTGRVTTTAKATTSDAQTIVPALLLLALALFA